MFVVVMLAWYQIWMSLYAEELADHSRVLSGAVQEGE